MSKGKVIVSGILFFYPMAGVTYQFLHYLIGLRRLGYDAYYVEDSARWVFNPRLGDLTSNSQDNVQTVAAVLEQYGFADRWAFREARNGGKCYGLTERDLDQLYRDADALLNVTGAQDIREAQAQCALRLYVETDPFSCQVAIAQADKAKTRLVSAHTAHFSFGENIGAADCTVPATSFEWLATRQPVVMDLWANGKSSEPGAFNTVTTWRNDAKPVLFNGEAYYWTKDREFEKVLDLPRRRPGPFELAISNADESVRSVLREKGWQIRDAWSISETLAGYQNYIYGARAEFTVARDQYVRPRTGWFSDRSACYLAAGKPVITQETGFSKFLPTGQGLFGFQTTEEILAAIDAIASDYAGQCRAARDLAEEYFSAEKNIHSLLERGGLS